MTTAGPPPGDAGNIFNIQLKLMDIHDPHGLRYDKTEPWHAAFARPEFYHEHGNSSYDTTGLTKREYFAAIAMQGILANERTSPEHDEETAFLACRLADSLIARLNITRK
jgi:hypothetical protein